MGGATPGGAEGLGGSPVPPQLQLLLAKSCGIVSRGDKRKSRRVWCYSRHERNYVSGRKGWTTVLNAAKGYFFQENLSLSLSWLQISPVPPRKSLRSLSWNPRPLTCFRQSTCPESSPWLPPYRWSLCRGHCGHWQVCAICFSRIPPTILQLLSGAVPHSHPFSPRGSQSPVQPVAWGTQSGQC